VTRIRCGQRRQRGASAIEFAIAAPVLFMLGLGALQWALVFHARQAVEHAAIEAARAGSLGHALPEAIEAGLARGLLPFWASLPEVRAAGERQLAAAAAQLRVAQARTAGWVVIRLVSPTVESFTDWAEPALDGFGRPMPGQQEIPNDGLQFAGQRSPRSAPTGASMGLPVGARSGQTLLEANLLKIEIVYGVPMNVPLVGRLAALAGQAAIGCLAAERGGCAVWQAPDITGRTVPRWPVSAYATIRMQSPARQTAATPTDAAARAAMPGPSGTPPSALHAAAATPADTSSPADTAAPADTASPVNGSEGWNPGDGLAVSGSPGGSPAGTRVSLDAGQDGSRERAADGWLSLGGERSFSVPGACVL